MFFFRLVIDFQIGFLGPLDFSGMARGCELGLKRGVAAYLLLVLRLLLGFNLKKGPAA